MTSLRFLSQQRGAREIPGGNDKQGVVPISKEMFRPKSPSLLLLPRDREKAVFRSVLVFCFLWDSECLGSPVSASVNGGQFVVLILVGRSSQSNISNLKMFSSSGFHDNTSEFPPKSLANLPWFPNRDFFLCLSLTFYVPLTSVLCSLLTPTFSLDKFIYPHTSFVT